MGAGSSTRLDPGTDTLGEKPALPTSAAEVSQEIHFAGPPELEPRHVPLLPQWRPSQHRVLLHNPLLLRLEILESWRTPLIICRHAAIPGTV